MTKKEKREGDDRKSDNKAEARAEKMCKSKRKMTLIRRNFSRIRQRTIRRDGF